MTVFASPVSAIRIELTWTTPGKPTPGPGGASSGSDLDLHFAHPEASGPDVDCDGAPDPWFSTTYDAFFFNPNPNWGALPLDVNDDPSLATDSATDGAPEILVWDTPEGTVGTPMAYGIGVHNWNAHGFGPSQPTVTIWIEGVKVAQVVGPLMQELDMWTVGELHWPNVFTAAGSTQDPFLPCKQSAPPCTGGSRWRAKGDPCLTPCYVSPGFAKVAASGKSAGCGQP